MLAPGSIGLPPRSIDTGYRPKNNLRTHQGMAEEPPTSAPIFRTVSVRRYPGGRLFFLTYFLTYLTSKGSNV